MSSPGRTPDHPSSSTTIQALFEALRDRLQLDLLAGADGLGNAVVSPRIQKLGLSLAGYSDYVHAGRVQFMGGTEINYLQMLSAEERKHSIECIFSRDMCCILVTRGLDPPPALLQCCNEKRIPVLRTQAQSSAAIAEVTAFLQEKLAPTTTIHGVLMEVFGLGVLMFGPSGIGKSECALDLIMRGHRLVSDDVVIIRKHGTDHLIGSGPAEFQFHMELRGLGIINIKDLFGVSALSNEKAIDLAIHLVRWNPEEEYDRLGLDEKQYSLLDVAVPLIAMPVAPGRNLATLVEVAVRIQLLKGQGYNPSHAFVKKLEGILQRES